MSFSVKIPILEHYDFWGKFMYKSRGSKGAWVLVLFLLAGIVLFGFLADVTVDFANRNGISFLNWLRAGASFGISPPFGIDLGIITISIGFTIKLTIAGIIGMLVAYLVYRRA